MNKDELWKGAVKKDKQQKPVDAKKEAPLKATVGKAIAKTAEVKAPVAK